MIVHGLAMIPGDLDLDDKNRFAGIVGSVGVDHSGPVQVGIGQATIFLGKDQVALYPGDFVVGQYLGRRAVSFLFVERTETTTRVVYAADGYSP